VNITGNIWAYDGWAQVDSNGNLDHFYGQVDVGSNALDTVRFDTEVATTFDGGTIYFRSR
jgi:hypothetical protein